jgi:hypothetical protein
MSTIFPSEDDATQHYDSSDDDSKNVDKCRCDYCGSDLLRPHAIAITYDRSIRRAYIPWAGTGGLSSRALMKPRQESFQESCQAHRVAMMSTRVYTGQAEAGTSGQAPVGTVRQALPSSYPDYSISAPMPSARVHTGQAEAGTSCQAKVGTLRQASPSSHSDYTIPAPKRRRLKRDRIFTHSDK